MTSPPACLPAPSLLSSCDDQIFFGERCKLYDDSPIRGLGSAHGIRAPVRPTLTLILSNRVSAMSGAKSARRHRGSGRRRRPAVCIRANRCLRRRRRSQIQLRGFCSRLIRPFSPQEVFRPRTMRGNGTPHSTRLEQLRLRLKVSSLLLRAATEYPTTRNGRDA